MAKLREFFRSEYRDLSNTLEKFLVANPDAIPEFLATNPTDEEIQPLLTRINLSITHCQERIASKNINTPASINKDEDPLLIEFYNKFQKTADEAVIEQPILEGVSLSLRQFITERRTAKEAAKRAIEEVPPVDVTTKASALGELESQDVEDVKYRIKRDPQNIATLTIADAEAIMDGEYGSLSLANYILGLYQDQKKIPQAIKLVFNNLPNDVALGDLSDTIESLKRPVKIELIELGESYCFDYYIECFLRFAQKFDPSFNVRRCVEQVNASRDSTQEPFAFGEGEQEVLEEEVSAAAAVVSPLESSLGAMGLGSEVAEKGYDSD